MAGTRTLGRRLARIGLGVLALAMLAAASWWYAVHWHPSLDAYPMQGMDVSADSGAIDWPVARAGGADFAYIRATAGAERRDPLFAANWAGAHAAGVRRGAVHLYKPCEAAGDQANNFIVTVPRVADALPAAVEIDDDAGCAAPPTRAVLIEQLAAFLRTVETHTGKPVMMMIPPAVELRYDLARAFERPLWAGRDYLAPTYLSRPWRMWRANDARRIEAAEQPVGWDVVAP